MLSKLSEVITFFSFLKSVIDIFIKCERVAVPSVYQKGYFLQRKINMELSLVKVVSLKSFDVLMDADLTIFSGLCHVENFQESLLSVLPKKW